jgi:peptide deformylase
VPIRPILTVPDTRLRLTSAPVTTIGPEVQALAKDLVDTLLSTSGIGISAPQIGVNVRLIVLELSDRTRAAEVLLNPEILSSFVPGLVEESCLSIPGVEAKVIRATRLRFRAQTLTGEWVEREAEGMEAVCLQHEVDHLNGVLLTDRISALKRLWLRFRGRLKG